MQINTRNLNNSNNYKTCGFLYDSGKTFTAPDWGGKPYYSLDYYLKQTFGEKVYRLSLNGGMTCPNRDGTLSTGGCIFCSEGGSGDFASSGTLSISRQIEDAKIRIQAKTSCKKFIAYFQAYTNTYASVSYLKQIFEEAIHHPDIVALSIGTRADCISSDVLELLAELNQIKPVWIELGLQTIHASTHARLNTHMSIQCFEEATARLSSNRIPVIAHLILGLPGESKEDMLSSLSYTTDLPISGIKLQLLHVLKGTSLAELYDSHPFPVFSLEEYTDFIVECIGRIPPDIVIHRLTGDGPKKLLLAPSWSGDKKRVLNTIHHQLKEKNIWQGKYLHQT